MKSSQIVPVVGLAALLLLSSARNGEEPVVQASPTDVVQSSPVGVQNEEVLARLEAIEELVQKHTQLVQVALTDSTPPVEKQADPPAPTPVQGGVPKIIKDLGSQNFMRARKESSKGAQAVLYCYGSEGWERINAWMNLLTESGIEHPHIVDLLECSPEEKEMAEAAKTEQTNRPWLQTLHSEDGAFGPIWYPLDRLDSAEMYLEWLRGNSETVQQQGNWQQNQTQQNYGYTYYPTSYSTFSQCVT